MGHRCRERIGPWQSSHVPLAEDRPPSSWRRRWMRGWQRRSGTWASGTSVRDVSGAGQLRRLSGIPHVLSNSATKPADGSFRDALPFAGRQFASELTRTLQLAKPGIEGSGRAAQDASVLMLSNCGALWRQNLRQDPPLLLPTASTRPLRWGCPVWCCTAATTFRSEF